MPNHNAAEAGLTELPLHGRRGNSDPAPSPANPPAWLPTAAHEVWTQLAPHVPPGRLTPATAHAFAMLCVAVATYTEANQLVQDGGLLIAEGQALIPNPALAIRDRNDAIITKWAREFGLTPDTNKPTGKTPRRLPHLVEEA